MPELPELRNLVTLALAYDKRSGPIDLAGRADDRE
jgi:hypothetical protein